MSHRHRTTNKSGNSTASTTRQSQAPGHKEVEGECAISPGMIVATELDMKNGPNLERSSAQTQTQQLWPGMMEHTLLPGL